MSITTDNLKTERGISFDRNGNITDLSCYGTVGLDASLTFTHTGNRLTGVLAWGICAYTMAVAWIFAWIGKTVAGLLI